MISVLVFEMEAEAERALQPYFDQNSRILQEIKRQMQPREEQYRTTLEYTQRHGEERSAELTVEEIRSLLPHLPQGEKLTSVFRLYASGSEYLFGVDFVNTRMLYPGGPYPSIETMVAGTHGFREELNRSPQRSEVGLTITPLFFSVNEHYRFCSELKKSLELEDPFGRGLTREEVQEFERNYLKKMPN
ncbi:MAG TPA: hypothetical protein VJA18_07215 [Candidatus Nanoarchaeia archaeon]|nr:hypothetical protein [Candidatus Nanoarchaeia archaeon]